MSLKRHEIAVRAGRTTQLFHLFRPVGCDEPLVRRTGIPATEDGCTRETMLKRSSSPIDETESFEVRTLKHVPDGIKNGR